MPPAFESSFFNNRKKIGISRLLKPSKIEENQLI